MIQDIYVHTEDVDVLVINDGSTDRTAEVACYLGTKYCRVPLIQKSRQSGDFVVFLELTSFFAFSSKEINLRPVPFR